MTASNSSTFTIQVQIIKGRDNENISFNIRRYLSITGTCTMAKGFVQNGEDLSEHLLECKSIICFEPDMGQAVLDATLRLYNDRAEEGNPNPLCALLIEANTLSPASGGNLVLDIVGVQVVDVESQKFDVAGFKKRSIELRNETTEGNNQALAASAARKPVLKKANQVTSAQQSEEVSKPAVRSLPVPVRKLVSSIQPAEVVTELPF